MSCRAPLTCTVLCMTVRPHTPSPAAITFPTRLEVNVAYQKNLFGDAKLVWECTERACVNVCRHCSQHPYKHMQVCAHKATCVIVLGWLTCGTAASGTATRLRSPIVLPHNHQPRLGALRDLHTEDPRGPDVNSFGEEMQLCAHARSASGRHTPAHGNTDRSTQHGMAPIDSNHSVPQFSRRRGQRSVVTTTLEGDTSSWTNQPPRVTS